jgi:hypothetical protein
MEKFLASSIFKLLTQGIFGFGVQINFSRLRFGGLGIAIVRGLIQGRMAIFAGDF